MNEARRLVNRTLGREFSSPGGKTVMVGSDGVHRYVFSSIQAGREQWTGTHLLVDGRVIAYSTKGFPPRGQCNYCGAETRRGGRHRTWGTAAACPSCYRKLDANWARRNGWDETDPEVLPLFEEAHARTPTGA